MPQVINSNIPSLNAQRNLNRSQSQYAVALQRLSSGLRINSAKDDAAGLAIATRFDAQITGLGVAIRNAGDGVSLAQTAEGALGAMQDNLLRIRDLALQAANASNSALDREALNAEVQQLKAEVQRLSDQTNFNGTKLLDGTFKDVTFQIGANEGETVSFGIDGARVDELGAAQTVGVSARGTTNAITQGDLIINGVTITSSKASDDTASVANKSASAIAKVSAINSHSDETGITAEVLTNTVAGTNQVVADQSGNIFLNGVRIPLAVDDDLASDANRDAVVAAINAYSGQTGVTAINTGIDASGITLEAEDGRNITLVFGRGGTDNLTAAATGLPTGNVAAGAPPTAAEELNGTTSGGFTLISRDNSNIKIEQGTDGQLNANVGLAVGTYSGSQAFVSSLADAGNALNTGDIVINGVPIPAGNVLDDTSSSTSKSTSAITKAAAINKVSEQTGVTAKANPNLVNGAAMTPAALTGNITINGVTTSTFSTTADAEESRLAVIAAINAISGQTGVIAIDTGSTTGGVQLLAEDGRNIDISFSTLTSAATGIAAADTYESSIQISSAGSFTLTSNTTNGLTNQGLTAGTFGGAETGQFIEDIDISTVEGALTALDAIDNALQAINLQRAKLGAIQNRFESTIANQAIAQENLSAANSRIKDADFAEETAELSRTTVLQQAGISVLAQANAQPQQVLSLLQS
ncbi:flagellin [Zooshikella marina]|uniref:flagellin N-terminal helical domain-containing protein n=1 Tax=Zooshikella ganghwensis TaxID=202772 RepID=UPI001BB09EB4|nr:flagellin [Zooshikella ganghwensis]MBU2706810.1 flagellin [Zooshikella ganghwensis]